MGDAAAGSFQPVSAPLAWRRRLRDGTGPVVLATAAFGWVCLQGAFGAWTVTQKLQPAIEEAYNLPLMIRPDESARAIDEFFAG